jgi:hypothetical protein
VGVRVSGTVVNGELPGSAARATAHAAGASSGAAIATMDAAARHRRIIKGSTTESPSSSVNITDAGAGATDTVSQSIGRGTDSVNVQVWNGAVPGKSASTVNHTAHAFLSMTVRKS